MTRHHRRRCALEEILRLLKTERLARDKVALELVAVQVTAKTLKAAIKAHDAKIADLVTDVAYPRPLLKLIDEKATSVEVVEETRDGGAVERAEDQPKRWHGYPIERLLGERGAELAGLLLGEELGTVGAIASWLSDGNEFEDLEVPVDDSGTDLRVLTSEEVRALRYVLLKFVEEQGIPGDFPLEWIDPTVRPLEAFVVEFKPRRRGQAARAPIILRAAGLVEAVDYAQQWPDVRVVKGHAGPVPEGARVEDVPRDSYDDRRRAHSLEIASRKSETGERAVH